MYNNHSKIISALLLCFFMIFALSACGKEESTESSSPATGEETGIEIYNAYFFDGEDLESLQNLRAEALSHDKDVAVARLGAVDIIPADIEENYDLYSEYLLSALEETGFAQKYPFALEMQLDRMFTAENGTELFLIVPPEGSPGIKLYRNIPGEEGTNSQGEQLAYTEFDSPLMLLIGSADDDADVFINIEGTKAAALVLAAGAPVPEDVYDFSPYAEQAVASQLAGHWTANGIADDSEQYRTISLEFLEDGSFAYNYVSEDEGFWFGKELMHFSGSWEDLGSGVLGLRAKADGGVYVEGGVPEYEVYSEYKFQYIEGSPAKLSLEFVSGDGFFQGISENRLLFSKNEVEQEEPDQELPEE